MACMLCSPHRRGKPLAILTGSRLMVVRIPGLKTVLFLGEKEKISCLQVKGSGVGGAVRAKV